MEIHTLSKNYRKNKQNTMSNKVNKMSSLNEIIKYQCEYCNKILSSRQSKWRHDKTCNKKNQIEKRLDILEDKIISNIDQKSIINILNLNISSIQTFCQMVNSLYYSESLKKITDNIKNVIKNNIKSFQVLSQNKNKFNADLRKQISYNLAVINKLEDYNEYIEYQGKKQYLFRNQVSCLKEIKNNENEIETIEVVDFSEESSNITNNLINNKKYELSDSDSDYNI
jgi:hypothetical protein